MSEVEEVMDVDVVGEGEGGGPTTTQPSSSATRESRARESKMTTETGDSSGSGDIDGDGDADVPKRADDARNRGIGISRSRSRLDSGDDSQISDGDTIPATAPTSTATSNAEGVEAKVSRCPFTPLASTSFWKKDGLFILGILLSIFIFLQRRLGFVMKHWIYQEGEGRIVSKYLIILMFIYIYSFVKLGTELCAMVDNNANLWFPETYRKMRKILKETYLNYPAFVLIRDRRSSMAITLPLSTLIGVMLWDTIWIMFVCKSHHDRSCTKTSIGKFLYDYRNEACRDGKTQYAICEKFISYTPMLALTILATIWGNLVMPNVNDHLHKKIIDMLTSKFMNGKGKERMSMSKSNKGLGTIRENSAEAEVEVDAGENPNPNLEYSFSDTDGELEMEMKMKDKSGSGKGMQATATGKKTPVESPVGGDANTTKKAN